MINLYARYKKGQSDIYTLKVRTGKQPANNFFKSLPDGIFSELQQVEADGFLDFSLNFSLDGADPDNLVFDVRMKKEKFKLKKYGSNSLLKMNSEFSHTVYEYEKPVKTFMVGLSNPDFVPIEQISPYLRNAILTSEDGSFFHHNGFNADAFRKSIAVNYRAGKFKRGGSTISMQLIKNVYLTRKKTVARKVEEAFIVWLIESNRLVSKERMFETYLNIIELGPYIYGVKEASYFYFDKLPAELTLSESIFLASLLPKPKAFKYSFDSSGTLKPYMEDYYRVVSNFLLSKNLITEQEHALAIPNIQLKGPAKELVLPSDTLASDTLLYYDPD
jgi:membrane peptidoglycan carboxypeptidase